MNRLISFLTDRIIPRHREKDNHMESRKLRRVEVVLDGWASVATNALLVRHLYTQSLRQ